MQRFWSQFDDYCDTIPELVWRKKKWILHDTKISHIDLKFDIDSDLEKRFRKDWSICFARVLIEKKDARKSFVSFTVVRHDLERKIYLKFHQNSDSENVFLKKEG